MNTDGAGADPIPAIREQDASGDTAILFADLRDTLGVPFVNLIWRHLATMPGMLAWTWGVVKPLHGTAALAEAAAALRASVRVPDGIGQPACVFDAVGVDAAGRRAVRRLVEDYTAANAVNLLCLLLARSLLAGERMAGSRHPAPPATRRRHAAAEPARPLLGLHELPPAVRALALELDTFGRLAPTDAVASLYRHLGHWPGFLAVTHAALAVPHRAGVLRAGHERLREEAGLLVRDRLAPLAAPAPAPPAAKDDALRSLDTFTGHMIARMVLMGEAMLAVLPPG